MKQNVIIILLTAAVVLLAVNLFEGRIPPRAMAAMEESANWAVGCPQSEDVCFFADSKGDVFRVSRGGVLFVGPARRQLAE